MLSSNSNDHKKVLNETFLASLGHHSGWDLRSDQWRQVSTINNDSQTTTGDDCNSVKSSALIKLLLHVERGFVIISSCRDSTKYFILMFRLHRLFSGN